MARNHLEELAELRRKRDLVKTAQKDLERTFLAAFKVGDVVRYVLRKRILIGHVLMVSDWGSPRLRVRAAVSGRDYWVSYEKILRADDRDGRGVILGHSSGGAA